MTDEEPEHCCSVTLIIVGDDLEPEEVSKALGMEAHHSWRRGERKNLVNPDGTTRYFDSVYEQGGWKRSLPASHRDLSLDEQFFFWFTRLQPLGEAIRSLAARGWEVELDCYAITSEVLILSDHHMRTLSAMRIGLALTLDRVVGGSPDGGATS